MILEVKQTNAVKHNEFDVIRDGNVIYRGNASWWKILEIDKLNKVNLTDPEGNVLLHTRYKMIDTFLGFTIPFKRQKGPEKKFCMYEILDASEQVKAVFYSVENAAKDVRLCLSFGGRVIDGYRRCMGLKEVVSFYENDTQIGQITRSRTVVDHLDQYYVHFLPEYDQQLPLIAMYAVFYDFLYHNNSGNIGKNTKTISLAYTHDGYDDKYQPDFIRNHFGEQEDERINALVPEKLNWAENKKAMTGLIAAVLIPLLVILMFVLLFWYLGLSE